MTKPKIIHIAPIHIINSESKKVFVNIYGLSDGGGVFIWQAKDATWLPYTDKALADATRKYKQK